MRVLLTILFYLMPAAIAWAGECTLEASSLAEKNDINPTDWKALYSDFKNYGNCDDGWIAEAFDEATIQLLIKDYPGFFSSSPRKSDKGFRQFIIRHINEVASVEELSQVISHAKKECPANESKFCKRIIQKARISSGNGLDAI